jgi:hypothetical protein
VSSGYNLTSEVSSEVKASSSLLPELLVALVADRVGRVEVGADMLMRCTMAESGVIWYEMRERSN